MSAKGRRVMLAAFVCALVLVALWWFKRLGP
jgi:hypothetical protein